MVPTSQLMEFFVEHKYPDVKSVVLDGLGDFQEENFSRFVVAMPNVQVLSMKGSAANINMNNLEALNLNLLHLDISGCENIHGE